MARPIQKPWRLHVVLLVVMCLIVARTLVLDRETPRELANSEAMNDSLEALSATKLAYSPYMILAQGKAGSKSKADDDLFGGMRKTEIVAQWRKLATAHTGRAAEWRRLGITLSLFHLKGGMDALRHVADHFPAPEKATHKGHLPHKQADPFGRRPVAIPAPQEIAMWQAIYGKRALTVAETSRYRAMLAQLHLGWFEDIASAQLYMRAGQRGQARASALAAARAVRLLNGLEILNVLVMIFGAFGLLIVGLIGFATWVQRTATSPPAGGAAYRGPPLTAGTGPDVTINPALNSLPAGGQVASAGVGAPGYGVASPPARRPEMMFPYGVLLLAFIIYLLSQEGVGLLASLALYPARARLEELSVSSLLRLTQLVQMLAYVPILVLPLLVVRYRIRFDPLTGQRIGWRQLLAHLGFRARNPFAEVGAGAIGYLLVAPAVFAAGLLSSWLFARFHTPQNPVEMEMLAAQQNLDRFLVLFVACVAAPFAEETFFRGILYAALRSRLGVWGGAALSSAIFALVHPTLPGGFLPIWTVGMGLALVFEWRRSLLAGMVLHGIYNGMITMMIFGVFAR